MDIASRNLPTENIAASRILVTGAAGFVGANLVRELIRQGAEVSAVIRPSTNTWRLNDLLDKMHIVSADLYEPAVIQRIQALRPDYVFHLAVQRARPLGPDFRAMLNASAIGTFNLLEALATTSFRRFVHIGSSTEYGRKSKPMREDDLLEPVSFHGAVKAAATMLVSQFARTDNRPVTLLRLFSVYGYWESASRLIPTAIRAALRNEKLALTDPGIRHDYVFVDDVVEACLRALQNATPPGEIVNIGSGEQYANEAVVDLIAELTGHSFQIEPGSYPAKPWDTSFWVADCSKAKQILGWQARHSLRRGMDKNIAWFRQNLHRYG